jgi:hypothetical protein
MSVFRVAGMPGHFAVFISGARPDAVPSLHARYTEEDLRSMLTRAGLSQADIDDSIFMAQRSAAV